MGFLSEVSVTERTGSGAAELVGVVAAVVIGVALVPQRNASLVVALELVRFALSSGCNTIQRNDIPIKMLIFRTNNGTEGKLSPR